MTALKVCKYCGGTNHLSLTCFRRPKVDPVKRYKDILKAGKVARGWARAKKRWYMLHNQESYNCHYCGRFLFRDEVELDHYLSRSRHPELRYDLDNLVPSCHNCNTAKGSLSGSEFKEKIRVNEQSRKI